MENGQEGQPRMAHAHAHRSDAYAQKLVGKTDSIQEKAKQKTPGVDEEKKDKGPAGGYDRTPIPSVPPGYTIKFTFHRATRLPMADINSMSSDPYIVAVLKTSLSKRHRQDPDMCWRTRTIRRNTSPEWNSEWIVANVPAHGFELKLRIYDEDPCDHDDRLGNVHLHVGDINENWEGLREKAYDIKKRMGSKRAYLIRGCAAMFNRNIHMSGQLVMSAQVLGKSEGESGGRTYTVGPCQWSQHLSPMIGRLAGTKDPAKDEKKESYKYSRQASSFT